MEYEQYTLKSISIMLFYFMLNFKQHCFRRNIPSLAATEGLENWKETLSTFCTSISISPLFASELSSSIVSVLTGTVKDEVEIEPDSENYEFSVNCYLINDRIKYWPFD